MSFLQNKSLGGIAIVGLLVVNSFLLVMLLRKPEVPPAPVPSEHIPPPPPPGEGPRRFMETELGFDNRQSADFGKLIEEHQFAMREIRDSIRVSREQLSGLLKSDSADVRKAQEIADEIGKKQSELEMVNYNHFREVREICTEEQKPKFDSIIEDAARAINPDGPPRGGPPMGPPPPHHRGPRDGHHGPPPPGGPPHPPGAFDGGPMPPPGGPHAPRPR